MKKIQRLFKHPDQIVGRIIHFVDRSTCKECCISADYEMCPDYENWNNCPLQVRTVYVSYIEYYRIGGQKFCKVNGKYEFSMSSIGREVFLKKYDAWLCMERQKKGRRRLWA